MAATRTTKVKRLPRDPRKPHKPMSSFLYFYQMHLNSIPYHPRMRFHIQSAMAKVAGEMWSKATKQERKGAYSAARKSQRLYKKALRRYKPPTQEQWMYILKNWPKRFRVNYNFFVMDRFAKTKKAHPRSGFGSISRNVATQWKNLSKKKKKHYYRKFLLDRERYYREVKALWASLN
jgi:HMG (high mobility group) box